MNNTTKDIIENLKAIEQMATYATLIVWLIVLITTLCIYFS